ncbi:MAG: hypothetical protein RL291_65 [Pseudomonadota bacterium]|jgi:hypothetical protein
MRPDAIWATALVACVATIATAASVTAIYRPQRPATAMDVVKTCADHGDARASQFCTSALAALKLN